MHTVLSISRQFGSGGREIGRKVAEEFGIPFYDSALITMAAQKSGMSQQVLKNIDEKAANRFLYTIPTNVPTLGYAATAVYNIPLSDTLFLTQYEIIKQVANEGPCVIVGRCSDYILREHPHHVSIFIHAPEAMRAKRIAQYENIDEKEALSRIAKYDKERKKYHDYYAAGTWGNAAFYDLSFNSASAGIDGSVRLIKKFVELVEEQEATQASY